MFKRIGKKLFATHSRVVVFMVRELITNSSSAVGLTASGS